MGHDAATHSDETWMSIRRGFPFSGVLVEGPFYPELFGSSARLENVGDLYSFDADEILCQTHLEAFGFNSSSRQVSLEISVRNETMTKAVKFPERQRKLAQFRAGDDLVVKCYEGGDVYVALPKFLRWRPARSSVDDVPALDRAIRLVSPNENRHGLIRLSCEREIRLRFDPKYAKDAPMDQYRGFVFPPSRLATSRHYSEPVLWRIPEADMSMPFNLVAVHSTILAFFFGSVASTLVRKSSRQ